MKLKHSLKGDLDHIFHSTIQQINMSVMYLTHKQVQDLLSQPKSRTPCSLFPLPKYYFSTKSVRVETLTVFSQVIDGIIFILQFTNKTFLPKT